MPIVYAGRGVGGILEDLGISDPLTKIEPGLTPTEIFVKWSGILDHLKPMIATVGSTSVRSDLSRAWAELDQRRKSMAPFFAPGATPGSRDYDNLKRWVPDIRSFRSRLSGAIETYGATAAPGPAAAGAAPAETPTVVYLVGGGLALFALSKILKLW